MSAQAKIQLLHPEMMKLRIETNFGYFLLFYSIFNYLQGTVIVLQNRKKIHYY